MRVAYIAGPYRANTIADVVRNIRFAESYAVKYWKLGFAVICPHMNTALFDGHAEDSVWLAGGLELLRRCDVLVMIPGWQRSSGSIEELKLAEELNKEIIYERRI